MSVLKVKNGNNWDEIPSIKGKSAYQYAQEGGYQGTEQQFAAKLAQEIPTVDSTLAIQGAAADAKKVGDELTSVKGDLNSKLSSNQGSGNAGKWLTIANDGTVTAASLPVYSGGVS